MSEFDREKVQFSEKDLFAGAALDSVFESLRSGVDLMKVVEQIPNIQAVVTYLTEAGDSELPERVVTLAMVFARDNLDELINPPAEPTPPVVEPS